MSWNFCPWCSHRIYQHNGSGCTHVEHRVTVCTDPECTPGVELSPDAAHEHDVPIPCDCKRPWAAMAEGAITG